MPGARPRRPGLQRTISVVCIAAILVAARVAAAGNHPGSAGNHPGSANVPAKDRFSLRITGGSGQYASARGAVEVLYVHAGSQAVKLVFRGARCSAQTGCVLLSGTVPARTVRRSHIADVGSEDMVSGTGRLAPVGAVTLTGSAQGTGFIRQGRETLSILLSTRGGALRLTGQSGVVRGFTSP